MAQAIGTLKDVEIGIAVDSSFKGHLNSICRQHHVKYTLDHIGGILVKHYRIVLDGDSKDISRVVAYLRSIE